MTRTAKAVKKFTGQAKTFFDARPITSMLTLVGIIGGGFWAAETHWVNAAVMEKRITGMQAETDKKFAEVTGLYLRSGERGLRQEKYQLEREQEQLRRQNRELLPSQQD